MDLGLFFEESSNMMKNLVLGRVLLTSKVTSNRFAGMTIAWGFFGNMWNDIYFIAAVRPSRHTFLAINESKFFTVNFFDQRYKKELRYFGTSLCPKRSKSSQCFVMSDKPQ